MKGLTKTMLFFSLCALCACQMEMLEDPSNPEAGNTENLKEMELSVSMPSGMTKTSLGEKGDDSTYPVYWTEGDVLSVNGDLTSAVTSGDSGTSEVRFSVRTAQADNYNILYPGVAGVADKVTFSASQEYKEGTFDTNALPMYATTTPKLAGSTLTMNYLASVIRIPISFTKETTLARITVSAGVGESLAGTFVVGKDDNGAFNGELTPESTSMSIDYTFGTGVTFTAENEGVFHITIPKGTYDDGLSIRIYDSEYNYMDANAVFEGNIVEAGKVYEFESREFKEQGSEFLIYDVATLQEFAKERVFNARVIADIDMTGQSYNPDNFNFYGTLEGGGHTIIGLTIPMFNKLYGTVRNLILDSDITNSALYADGSPEIDNKHYGVGILASYLVKPDEFIGETGVDNVHVKGSIYIDDIRNNGNKALAVGGLVGASNGVPISNCTSEVAISVEPTSVAAGMTLRLGGICGATQTSATCNIYDCANNGTISVDGFISTGDLLVGGIVAYSSMNNSINRCENSATITLQNNSMDNLYVGGIFCTGASKNMKMDSVHQTESASINIASTNTTSTAYYIGGIVASNLCDITNSSNRAPITVAGTTTNGNVAVGGVSGRCQGTLSNASNYGDVTITSEMNATVPDGVYVGGVVGNANNDNTSLSGTIYNEGAVNCAVTVSKVETTTESTDEETGVTTTETTTQGGSLFLGGLVGDFTGGSSNAVSGQSNKGNVTVTATVAADAYIGGAVGRNRKSISVYNYGSVTVDNSNLAEGAFIGGVAGYLESAITLDGCTNNAAVTVSGTPSCNQFIGGVFGSKSGAKMSILNCVNNEAGSVSISGTTEIESYIMLAGVLAGCPGGSSTISGCKNYGTVTNNYTGGSSNSTAVTIGGVVGRLTDSALGTLTLCENRGAIINNCPSTASGSSIRLGGIIGYTHQDITNGLTQNTNYGSLTNNAASANIITLGGVVAYNQSQNTISSCNNQGAVLNTADATKDISLGGIIGKSTNKTTTVTKCTNGVSGNADLGAVSNTGTSDTSEPNTQIGGIVGFADVITNVNASGDERSVNYGPVSDISASLHPAVGGVVGYTNKESDFSNACNEGAVSISGNVKTAYLGGVVGYATANIKMDYASNSGNLSFSNSKVLTQIWVGGVVSLINNSTARTHTGLTNSGAITINSGITSSSTSYNYIGGIIGSSDGKNKTFANCINTGDINMRTVPLKCRVGGIAGIANKNPEGSKCFADIDFKTSVSDNSHIGGVAGYLNISKYSNLTYKGNINSNGSSGTNYTGGIVGCTMSGTKTFSSCVVSGTMRGANSNTGMAGVFCNSSAQASYTFDSCKVGSGTIRKAGTDGTANATTITSTDQLVVGVLVGGKGAKSCTVTNCTVVDPATITLE